MEKLRGLLHELGVNTLGCTGSGRGEGFPCAVTLRGGGSLVLDLPDPALLSSLDPDHVGAALLDRKGAAIRLWGLARKVRLLNSKDGLMSTELGSLVEQAFEGDSGSLYIDGVRFYASRIGEEVQAQVFLLVTNAAEERQTRREAAKSAREAMALSRLGRALSMNTAAQPMCVAAVHEIASSWELAAVVLWVRERDSETLLLSAATGVNRQGITAMNRLSMEGSPTCLAELVAQSQRAANFGEASESLLCSDLEARFCYLKPGGVSVHPLVVGGQLLGVLELIGREGDRMFAESQAFFQTVAEHLALALNGACLFESFERLASHDPLTGIANHRTLQEVLRNRIAEAERTKQQIGAMMIDVDHFRSFNEDEGHDTGDAVLKLVADAIRGTVRQYDLAARYGGEEFTAILPSAGKDTTLVIAERIRKKVSSIPLVSRIGRVRHVTVSIGCAVFPNSAADGAQLLRAADQALFDAKKHGRNRVVFFEGEAPHDSQASECDDAVAWKWVSARNRKRAAERLKQMSRQIEHVSRVLGLSRTQVNVLRGAVILTDTYQSAKRGANKERLRAIESAHDLRLLLPTLHSLGERFDGRGPRGATGEIIPLLGRVFEVLTAIHDDSAAVLFQDRGRFDPDIVAILSDLEMAA